MTGLDFYKWSASSNSNFRWNRENTSGTASLACKNILKGGAFRWWL